MGMLGNEETAHIAQHHQDVLIHGVDVKQIVLHLPDDATEDPQVTPEHRGLVHQAHGMRDALGFLQNFQERGTVDRIGTEAAVHDASGVVQGAQGSRRQALDAHRGLVEQKSLQNRVRLLKVKVVTAHIDHARLVGKAFIDGLGVVCVVSLRQPFLDVQQQNLVQLGHGFGSPVVTLHQGFAGHTGVAAAVFLLTQTQGVGHLGLHVKHQAVLTALGHQVQTCANQRQGGFVALERARLQGGGQASARQGGPVVSQPRSLGHPQNDLQITQAAGRLFAIGLQGVGRVFKLGVPLAHFQRLGHEESFGVQGLGKAVGERFVQGLVAHNQARLQQRGLHRDVPFGLPNAVIHIAHAGANFQTGVPAAANEGLQTGFQGVILFG